MSLQGVGLSDDGCTVVDGGLVVELVVGDVISAGRGEGDGLGVVVDGVGCEV